MFWEKPKHHPVAFFSIKLSLAMHNYNTGNRELLAIIPTLEEWRHWLEGAEYHTHRAYNSSFSFMKRKVYL